MKRIAFAIVTASALSVTAISPAFAAGDGSFSFAVEGWYIIDFAILAGLMFWLLKGPAKRFIEGRHDRIKAELEAATRLREEAEARLAEVDALLSGLEGEIAKVREQFRQDGEREAARINTEAAQATERLDAALARQREQEAAKLREALEKELIAEVLTATEAKLQKKLNAKTQAKVASNFIDALEALPSLDRVGHQGRAA